MSEEFMKRLALGELGSSISATFRKPNTDLFKVTVPGPKHKESYCQHLNQAVLRFPIFKKSLSIRELLYNQAIFFSFDLGSLELLIL
jgi:hypothetical protein